MNEQQPFPSHSLEFAGTRPSNELTFVYGGVFLPWQDPSVSLSTLVEVRISVKLENCTFWGKHPVYTVNSAFLSFYFHNYKKPYVIAPGMVSMKI